MRRRRAVSRPPRSPRSRRATPATSVASARRSSSRGRENLVAQATTSGSAPALSEDRRPRDVPRCRRRSRAPRRSRWRRPPAPCVPCDRQGRVGIGGRRGIGVAAAAIAPRSAAANARGRVALAGGFAIALPTTASSAGGKRGHDAATAAADPRAALVHHGRRRAGERPLAGQQLVEDHAAENRSVRRSTVPASCSGDMCETVPSTEPIWVSSDVSSLAMRSRPPSRCRRRAGHVARLDVAVHDTALVRMLQRTELLAHEQAGFGEREAGPASKSLFRSRP